jgi:hypothetical protein
MQGGGRQLGELTGQAQRFLKGMNILSLLALDKGLGKAEHWDPVISTSLPRLEGPRDTLIYSREYLACLSLTPGP